MLLPLIARNWHIWSYNASSVAIDSLIFEYSAFSQERSGGSLFFAIQRVIGWTNVLQLLGPDAPPVHFGFRRLLLLFRSKRIACPFRSPASFMVVSRAFVLRSLCAYFFARVCVYVCSCVSDRCMLFALSICSFCRYSGHGSFLHWFCFMFIYREPYPTALQRRFGVFTRISMYCIAVSFVLHPLFTAPASPQLTMRSHRNA